MPCYLCGCDETKKVNGKVRDNDKLDILECKNCGLIFLSSFSHIAEGFYENSGMHSNDIDIKSWINETEKDDERRYQFLKEKIKNKSVLDFGCGNGGFLLRVRNTANKVYGIELEDKIYKYFNEQKLSVYKNISEPEGIFDIITLFHVIEHFVDPVKELLKISEKLSDNGEIIIETPNSNDALLKLYESKSFSEFTYWSCHVFLYNSNTLIQLAKKAGLKINFIKQVQRYSLANHLYWLSKGKPGGHIKWSFLENEILKSVYEKELAALGLCDTIIAGFAK